ncbi:hypothetical protein PPYR_10213 [Photinus pyralis]|uniref:RNA helicase n=2 Tax=Photinus pyralis TaxID=7054 RepID=A0A1Y1N7P9_PHOPY|nr:probable RNA helicase armi [Photinus pyralis]KAB0796152.1 hypothetical protein PPYR_10213 [Photinus pyralis]
MLRQLRSFVNYFLGGSTVEEEDSADTYDKICKILESNDEPSNEPAAAVEEEISQYSCFEKTGKITSADGNSYTVDETYHFTSDSQTFKIGATVFFTCYKSESGLRVCDVALHDEWSGEAITGERSWCRRTLPRKVSKREGRQIFLVPDNINFDLNEVCIEFVPMAGDWVELHVKVEIDETVSNLCGKILEIEQVRPLGSYLSEGQIKRWNSERQEGVINKTIFFNSEALMCGYVPFVGDKITAEIMESEQGDYSKRALKIVPQDLADNKVGLGRDILPKFDVRSDKVLAPNDIVIKSTKLGVKEKFQLPLKNKTLNDLVILNVSYPSSNSQCVLVKPEDLTNITMQRSKTVVFEGVCKTKYVGVSKELILFTFSNFKIGCWVTVNVELNTYTEQAMVYRFPSTACAQFGQGPLIKGRRSTPAARFIVRQLHHYPVPQRLIEIVSTTEKKEAMRAVRAVKQCLTSTLQFSTYEDYFHTLLHLDEIFQLESVKQYAQDYVCFIKNGEYLMLPIENLAERRPSLIVGDRIVAKDAYALDAQEYEGFIHKTDAKHVYVKFADSFHRNYDKEEMSVMVLLSRTIYKRMHHAISMAARDLRSAFLFPSKLTAKDPQVMVTVDDDKNLWITNEESKDKPNKTRLKWHNQSLNHYQKEAVRNILLGVARPLPYLIYGPPGTGKTVTLVETVLQILRFIPQSRIIVATPSNSAANLIALRLIDSGVLKPGDLTRLVGYHYATENLLPVELVPYSAHVDIAKEGTRENHRGYNLSVIGKHRIIIGTCSTLGCLYSIGITKGQFTHVVVDEAGQCTEPEIMIPLSLLDLSGQVILAGDPCQLGPVILSNLASEGGLTHTFLDRMLTTFPYIRDAEGFQDTDGYDPRLVTKLIYNYRSLPTILNMFNQLFYMGQLQPTISEVDSKEAKLLESLKEMLPESTDSKVPAVIFHGVTGDNTQSTDCPSWFNPNEASQIFFYVHELYRLGLKSTDIGIISPYIKQVRIIRSLLMEAEFDVPKVGTVEDFQGHECNVILLSTVRSSTNLLGHDQQYRLGFLANPKRLNVAISRAQVLLIIVGNPHLLGKDPHWRGVIKYCIENGAYCGCELPKI